MRSKWPPTAAMVAGIGLAVVLSVGVLLAWPRQSAGHTVATARQELPAPTSTAVIPPDSTAAQPAAIDPCQGMTGSLVTDHDGDQSNPLHVVAELEYAFYAKRDAGAVIALYQPGVLSSSAKTGIGTFISHIPSDVQYCVAATAVDTDTVNYDIKDIRPSADSNSPPTTKTFAMTLTVTSSPPYLISNLHTRK